MAKYRGVALITQWINPLGTLQIQNNFQTFDVQREVDLIDVSSGADLDHESIIGLRKGTGTLKFYDDTQTVANFGTAALAMLCEGTYGTLIWGPQGTAVNMPKGSFGAFVKTLKHSMPFDKALDIEIVWEKSGPFLADYGAHF